MGHFLPIAPQPGISGKGFFGPVPAGGIPAGQFLVVAANNSNPSAATSGGAAVRDSGGTWHTLNVSALGARGFYGCARDVIAGGRWLITTSTGTGGGNGLIGTAPDTAPAVGKVDTGIADQLSDLQANADVGYLIATLNNTVITSPAGLTTFTPQPAHGPGSYTLSGVNFDGVNGVVVGLGSASTGICNSPDGVTWTNLATSFTTASDAQVTANTLVFAQAHYAAVGGNLLATSADGAVWTVATFTHTTTALCIAYDSAGATGNIYVGDANGNVLSSATLAGLATAAAVNISPNPLRCATTTAGVVLFGDTLGNIYRSSDGGVTWHTEHPGLGALILTALANNRGT